MVAIHQVIYLMDLRLKVNLPTVTTPGIFKMTLMLGFHIEHQDNLVTG